MSVELSRLQDNTGYHILKYLRGLLLSVELCRLQDDTGYLILNYLGGLLLSVELCSLQDNTGYHILNIWEDCCCQLNCVDYINKCKVYCIICGYGVIAWRATELVKRNGSDDFGEMKYCRAPGPPLQAEACWRLQS